MDHKTLREHLDIYWDHQPNKYHIRKEQAVFYCYEARKDGLHLVAIRFVKDSNCLKDRVIDHAVQTGNSSFPVPMKALGFFDDTQMEERWGFVDDYELIDTKMGDMPLIKRKTNEKD